jgi:predicted transcriptional regulator
MSEGAYHPNAYLSRVRNVKRGLRSRTRILAILDKGSADAKTIAKEGQMHYAVVMHHLKLLHAEGIVGQRGSRPLAWIVTGMGQKRLVDTC